MKKLFFILFVVAFASCKPTKTKRSDIDSVIIKLDSIKLDSVLEYHTSQAIFYLPRNEVVHYCITSSPELNDRKDLLEFVNMNFTTRIVISDSLIELDSLNSKKYLQLKDVIKYATVGVLKSKQARVFDKKSMHYVDFIKLININGKYSGEIEIRLPSDSLALHYLKYIV